MPPRFAISMISMRRPEGAGQALEAVLAHGHDMHLFLTSNGCAETATLFLGYKANHSNITHFQEPTNTGFQEPHARAFREAAKMGCEFCLILNDDLIVPESFLEALVFPMDNDPLIAIVGQQGSCCQLDDQFHGGPGRLEYVEGSLALVRIDTIRRLRNNLWCPGLKFIYSEDSSLSLFVQEKGYKITSVPLSASHVRSATVNSADPETKRLCKEAQDANHEVNRKRWAYYIRRRSFDFPIVVKRDYAIGDVVLTTPIISAIRNSNPCSPIFVSTNYPEIFSDNPDVEHAAKDLPVPKDALVVDLNMSYENRPMKHILEAYEEAAREVITGLVPVEWKTGLYPSKEDMEWAKMFASQQSNKMALICADTSDWKGKEWPRAKFHEIAMKLISSGFGPVYVGTKFGNDLEFSSLVGRTSILQLAGLCSQATLMVTGDSAPLHIAQAMGCPTVGIYGATLPEFISTQSSTHSAAVGDRAIHCTGQRHREHGKTFVSCDGACIQSVSVDDVWQAVERLGVL